MSNDRETSKIWFKQTRFLVITQTNKNEKEINGFGRIEIIS